MELDVPDEEIARREASGASRNRHRHGVLAKFAALVRLANEGAVRRSLFSVRRNSDNLAA
ncbi:hypothetical protein [Rhizobium viscosum]|uniref:hypothetical protein n=1 Tax=Rhizobium viscosum TaxID=1673 RepID=UPI001AED69DE